MTRQRKSHQQRAEEALAVAERRVNRLTAEYDKHMAAAAALSHELKDAERRRDYLAKDPALAPAPTEETP